jgi:hypothetical protein
MPAPRLTPTAALTVLLGALALLARARPARADAFDHYTNPVLARLVGTRNVKEVKHLTPDDVVDNDRVLPGIPAAFLVVKTNGDRYAKLLVGAARQKVSADRSMPILLVERFVTYKEGEERTAFASGRGVTLFPGFRLSLDLGQVVPKELGGDLRFVADGDKVYAEPAGKARLFLVTRALADAAPKRPGKFVMGEKFEAKYFNGTFKLHDDGRRSGTLKLNVAADGTVTGAYYSDKDGRKYELKGKVGTPAYVVEFTVKYPRTEQTFRGLMFTGTGKAIAGTARMAGTETGFYAVREE